MRVLIACEFSGRVRDAFRRRGHDAWSCDLLPSKDKRFHIRDDVCEHLKEEWDLVIAHPPCTYLCNSGVQFLHKKKHRYSDMVQGCMFFIECLNANAQKVCVENPIMHGYAKHLIGVEHSQTIHPYQFGHGESKGTCLWLKGLPLLEPTNVVEGRVHKLRDLSPSPERHMLRSITYQGIADAMAEQWG